MAKGEAWGPWRPQGEWGLRCQGSGQGNSELNDISIFLFSMGVGGRALVQGKEITCPRSCPVGTWQALGSHPHTLPKPSWAFHAAKPWTDSCIQISSLWKAQAGQLAVTHCYHQGVLCESHNLCLGKKCLRTTRLGSPWGWVWTGESLIKIRTRGFLLSCSLWALTGPQQ